MHLIIKLEYGLIKSFRWEAGLKACEDRENTNAIYTVKQTFQDFVTGKEKTTTHNYCSIPFCSTGSEKDCDLKVNLFLFEAFFNHFYRYLFPGREPTKTYIIWSVLPQGWKTSTDGESRKCTSPCSNLTPKAPQPMGLIRTTQQVAA